MPPEPDIKVEDTTVVGPDGTSHRAVKVTLILTPEYVWLMHELLHNKKDTDGQ